MNKFIVTGNLTKDADLKYTPNDKAYSKFSIANNEGFGENKKTNFFNCTLFGKSAESLNRFLIKGQKVLITGRVKLGKYTDKEGIERTTTDIIVDSFGGVELIGNKVQQESETDNYVSDNNDLSTNDNDDMTPIDDGLLPF